MKNCQTIEKMLQMSSEDRTRASYVVARSFFRMLRRNGFLQSEIMNFAGQLLDEVIKDIAINGKDREENLSTAKHLDVPKDSMEVA
jgi:hypothetical protein